ncbi:MAG: hypothetical protein ACOYEP_06485 [Limnochordia bacterium]|jgi:membrane protein YdbS with pleckstrin-like domain
MMESLIRAIGHGVIATYLLNRQVKDPARRARYSVIMYLTWMSPVLFFSLLFVLAGETLESFVVGLILSVVVLLGCVPVYRRSYRKTVARNERRAQEEARRL